MFNFIFYLEKKIFILLKLKTRKTQKMRQTKKKRKNELNVQKSSSNVKSVFFVNP